MTRRIDTPGVYDLPSEVYHRDPVVEPSLSRSIAELMVTRTPRHAWLAHPRLNPDHVETKRIDFDIGKAFEQVLLEGDEGVVMIDADSYSTKVAKEARDAAYAAGKVPLLGKHFDMLAPMVQAARAQLAAHPEARDAFVAGKPQQTLVWCEGGVWCRALLDWLPDERTRDTVYYDVKTTSDANPEVWQRACFAAGGDMQAAFYLRGIRALLGGEAARFRFVVVERKPPYALVVVELTPAALALGEAKVHRALELWRACLGENRWPGYPAHVAYLDLPAWEERRLEDAKTRDEALRQAGLDPIRTMIDWQAPAGVAPEPPAPQVDVSDAPPPSF